MDDETNASVGRAVRARRDELGISQATLASQLGISQPMLVKLEQGRGVISMSRLASIATLLKTDLAALFLQSYMSANG